MSACTWDSPLAKARGLSSRTGEKPCYNYYIEHGLKKWKFAPNPLAARLPLNSLFFCCTFMFIFYIIGVCPRGNGTYCICEAFFFFGPHRNYSFWSESSSAAVLSVRNEGTLSCLAWIATYRQ